VGIFSLFINKEWKKVRRKKINWDIQRLFPEQEPKRKKNRELLPNSIRCIIVTE
jgi:hypothetical protein